MTSADLRDHGRPTATAAARVRRAQKRKRIETVVNAPRDLGCNARLPNLDELQARARAANRRILET